MSSCSLMIKKLKQDFFFLNFHINSVSRRRLNIALGRLTAKIYDIKNGYAHDSVSMFSRMLDIKPTNSVRLQSRSINADKRNSTWQLHQEINRQIIKIEVKEFSACAQFMSIRFRCSNGFYDVRTKLRFSFLTLQHFFKCFENSTHYGGHFWMFNISAVISRIHHTCFIIS